MTKKKAKSKNSGRSLFLILADNGNSYEDFSQWPCFFCDSKEDAERFSKAVNSEIDKLFAACMALQGGGDLFTSTAAKSYERYLNNQGILGKYSESFNPYNRYAVLVREIPEGIVL